MLLLLLLLYDGGGPGGAFLDLCSGGSDLSLPLLGAPRTIPGGCCPCCILGSSDRRPFA